MDNVSIGEDSDMSASFPDPIYHPSSHCCLKKSLCTIRLARCRLVPLMYTFFWIKPARLYSRLSNIIINIIVWKKIRVESFAKNFLLMRPYEQNEIAIHHKYKYFRTENYWS
jgi:hypothetical protein